MFYFSINFTARINGTRIETGLIGYTTRLKDFQQNQVKNAIRDHYKKEDSAVRTVGVVITGHEKMDKDEFESAAGSFLIRAGK